MVIVGSSAVCFCFVPPVNVEVPGCKSVNPTLAETEIIEGYQHPNDTHQPSVDSRYNNIEHRLVVYPTYYSDYKIRFI